MVMPKPKACWKICCWNQRSPVYV